MAQAGKIVSEKDALKWASEFKEFLGALECGGVFEVGVIKKLLYDYGENRVKALWVRFGIKQGRPEVIIHAVDSVDLVTEESIIGSAEDGKPPQD